ncbi:MAG TPA: hypothetical protein VGH74_04855 [Planctomycetaceae bacterium]
MGGTPNEQGITSHDRAGPSVATTGNCDNRNYLSLRRACHVTAGLPTECRFGMFPHFAREVTARQAGLDVRNARALRTLKRVPFLYLIQQAIAPAGAA